MAARTTLDVLTSVVSESGLDVYSNQGPLIQQPVGEAAFGGSILSQAISAASATVQPHFYVFSSQSSFLRPVRAKDKVQYHVERTMDGRTSATRVVRVTQSGGPCLYMAIISFQKCRPDDKSAPQYAEPVPDLNGLRPDDLSKQDFPQLFQLSEEGSKILSAFGVSTDDPFDWRLLPLQSVSNSAQIRTHGFVRAAVTTQSDVPNLAAMSFLSDISLLELSIMTNWGSVSEETRALVMSTTLNSRVTLYAPLVDEWMVCESGTSWVASDRITTYQRFWNFANGELLMECIQDAVIKHKRAQI
ncbi:hypothetical protein G7054_g6535 [Neopestalotiopsis clavispora]|nr:hypothetical protein G7054_g6535 [Neopestalotiopsis clavispora]